MQDCKVCSYVKLIEYSDQRAEKKDGSFHMNEVNYSRVKGEKSIFSVNNGRRDNE